MDVSEMDTLGKVNKQIAAHDEAISRLTREVETLQKRLTVDLKSKDARIKELEQQVATTNANPIESESIPLKIPGTGDHVVAMWGRSKWQYFTATIVSFDRESLMYTIDWDDNDPTGREIHYTDIALDHVPKHELIGIGSNVLFSQGQYKGAEVSGTQRSAGLRWHQGIITQLHRTSDGK